MTTNPRLSRRRQRRGFRTPRRL